MAPKKTIKVGPQAPRPPANQDPFAVKKPGTASALPPGSPKRPPITGKGRI
jgi:hypothetical protein